MFNSLEVKNARESKTKSMISDAQNKIKEISLKISDIAVSSSSTSAKSKVAARNSENEWDWTNSYSKFENYEDIDELRETRKIEESKIESLAANFNNLGHYHDHSKEREMFEKSEEDKLKLCEQYRVIGNYLFHEGLYSKAAQQFQITIAFYEYCFPITNEEQAQLDNLRHRCLCNISKCYIYLGQYRSALQSAELVIKESKGHDSTWLKAMYRRAVAYRYLDEYELALSDLKIALTHAPGDTKIIEEIHRVKSLSDIYIRSKTVFAKQGIQIENISEVKNTSILTNVDDIRSLHSQLIAMPLEPIPTQAVQNWNKTLLSLTNHKS